MNPIYVRGNDPGISKVLGAVGLEGTKSVQVEITPTLSMQNTWWDGGGRYSYHVVELATGRVLSVPHHDPPQFGGPTFAPNLQIPEGAVVVEVGQGTVKGVRIYAPPDTIPKALSAPPDALPWAERVVLAATARLKASYGGVRDLRRQEAKRDTGITDQEYDAAKASLIQKRLLNSVGSISIEGRNAIGRTQLWDLKRASPDRQVEGPKPESVRSLAQRLFLERA